MDLGLGLRRPGANLLERRRDLLSEDGSIEARCPTPSFWASDAKVGRFRIEDASERKREY